MDEQAGAKYLHDLGALVNNFHVLEYMLRAYLYEHEGPEVEALPIGLDWYEVKPGDELPVNALTSFESLGQLIDRYNALVASHAPEDSVDRSVVELRDALAHGRISGAPDSPHLTLLKFDRPTGGKVRVTVAQPLTADWLSDQHEWIFREGEKVYRRRNADI